MVYGERGLKEGLEEFYGILDFGRMKGEWRSIYLGCDFNGRKLKDLSLLCCISILLEVCNVK